MTCYACVNGHTSVYSSSVGKSIQASANRRDSQKVGCTGPIKHATPPSLITLHGQHKCALCACLLRQEAMLSHAFALESPGHHAERANALLFLIQQAGVLKLGVSPVTFQNDEHSQLSAVLIQWMDSLQHR